MERAAAEEGEEEEASAAAHTAGDAAPTSITTIMAERWYGEARMSEGDAAASSSWLPALPTPTLPRLPSMGLSKRSAAAPQMQSSSFSCLWYVLASAVANDKQLQYHSSCASPPDIPCDVDHPCCTLLFPPGPGYPASSRVLA